MTTPRTGKGDGSGEAVNPLGGIARLIAATRSGCADYAGSHTRNGKMFACVPVVKASEIQAALAALPHPDAATVNKLAKWLYELNPWNDSMGRREWGDKENDHGAHQFALEYGYKLMARAVLAAVGVGKPAVTP